MKTIPLVLEEVERLLKPTTKQKVKTMEDLLNIGQALGRSEMKKLMAGSGGESCLICHTPGGTEEWSRTAEGDPTSACESIYPAYEDGEVSGSWGVC